MNPIGLAALAAAFSMAVAMAPPQHSEHPHYLFGPFKTVEYTYPVKMPEVKCGHNLLIGCDKPDDQTVPCKSHTSPSESMDHHHYEVPWEHNEASMEYHEAPGAYYEDYHEPMVASPRHKFNRKHKMHRHHHRRF